MATSNKYSPTPPPQTEVITYLVQWIYSELKRVAAAVEALEATTVNYGKEYVTHATGATTKIAWRNGQKQSIMLEADTTVEFVQPLGACNIMLRLVQDDTGGRDFSLPCEVHFAGGKEPTWSTAANAVDVVAMYFDGAVYHASSSIDSKTWCVSGG